MSAEPCGFLEIVDLIVSGRSSSACARLRGYAAAPSSCAIVTRSTCRSEAGGTAAHLAERFGIAGGEEAVDAFARRVVLDSLARERLRYVARSLLCEKTSVTSRPKTRWKIDG